MKLSFISPDIFVQPIGADASFLLEDSFVSYGDEGAPGGSVLIPDDDDDIIII